MNDGPDDLNAWVIDLSAELRAALTRYAISDPERLLEALPPNLREEFGRAYLKLLHDDEIFGEVFHRLIVAEFGEEIDE